MVVCQHHAAALRNVTGPPEARKSEGQRKAPGQATRQHSGRGRSRGRAAAVPAPARPSAFLTAPEARPALAPPGAPRVGAPGRAPLGGSAAAPVPAKGVAPPGRHRAWRCGCRALGTAAPRRRRTRSGHRLPPSTSACRRCRYARAPASLPRPPRSASGARGSVWVGAGRRGPRRGGGGTEVAVSGRGPAGAAAGALGASGDRWGLAPPALGAQLHHGQVVEGAGLELSSVPVPREQIGRRCVSLLARARRRFRNAL